MNTPVTEPIPLDFDRDDPLRPVPAVLERLAGTPIRRVRYPNGGVAWLVTGHDLARQVLGDGARFTTVKDGSQPGRQAEPLPSLPSPAFLLGVDGELHRRYRAMVNGEFMVKRMTALRPRVQEIVDRCLDEVAAAPEPVDLVSTFCLLVPSLVIADLVGVAPEHRAAFQAAAMGMLGLKSTVQTRDTAIANLGTILDDVIDARSREPRDDVVSRLLAEQPGLARQEVRNFCVLFLVAGHETTANAAGVAIGLLLENPDQLATLRENSGNARQFVHEIVRYLGALGDGGGLLRRALVDVELGGRRIAAGEWVAVSLPGANLDPGVCPHAARLDLDRAPAPHLTFGFGEHVCLGQNLAKLELEVMLGTLFARFPGLRLAVPAGELPWRTESIVRGYRALPVHR
ncbi:cytochrome P450 [Nocardia sp. GAS34]|uniref:cytochrome P450 n=1 Tax=unclassified Nocardia TaxID=2637762 RepID=UPI003D1E2010